MYLSSSHLSVYVKKIFFLKTKQQKCTCHERFIRLNTALRSKSFPLALIRSTLFSSPFLVAPENRSLFPNFYTPILLLRVSSPDTSVLLPST